MAPKKSNPPAPLRLLSSTPLLSRYPYGLWMDAVLADVFPGLRWAEHDALLVGPLGPGLLLCIYAASPDEIRIDLAPDTSSEPVSSFGFSPRAFQVRDFLSWFRGVVEHVQEKLALLERVLGLPADQKLLEVGWPQSKVGCLDFPLHTSCLGSRRQASLIFEDAATLSRNQDLWPLCGLSVLVGCSDEANTFTAALLAQADQAAAKSHPVYVFRAAAARTCLAAAGVFRDQVASRLFLAPDGHLGSSYLRGVLMPEAQTVIADLGAQIYPAAGPHPEEAEWVEQLTILSSEPTSYALFLRAPLELDAAACTKLILQACPQVARIYWVESAGRICPLHAKEAEAASRPLPHGIIFHPFS